MGRNMFEDLGYLFCSAEGWSMMGPVLSQIQVSWNVEYLEGMKEWSGWLPIYLNSIICNSLGWRVGFSFLFSLLFLKKIAPLSFADIIWILWSFDWKALCGMKWGISASESGVIISKKREGRRREDHSPSLKSCKLWSSNKSEKEAIYFISSYLPNIPCSMKSEFG